jgi:hypothetical protein
LEVTNLSSFILGSICFDHVLSLAAIRGSKAPKAEEWATKCEKEKNWRFNYQKHFNNLVLASAYSADCALGASNAGIEYMHKNFEYVDPENPNNVRPFDEYMAASAAPYDTATIDGVSRGGKPLVVPYKGKDLTGAALKSQLNAWANYGTIEPDAASSISKLVDAGDVNLSGRHFVVIGAGSAMGPYTKLLEHGATIIAIDIPGSWGEGPKKMWERLVTTARKSSGKLYFPLSRPQSQCATDADLFAAAGCNLTEQPARILAWIKSIYIPANASLTVGNYTYLDSDMHVKLSLAADAIIQGLCQHRPNTSVAFLCTPTDLHVITEEAYKASLANYGFHPGKLLETFINLLSLGKFLRKNALPPAKTQDGGSLKIVDGLSVAQGPNYALAKRLQHWRAMVEFNAGRTVSSNIAPSTATLSVVSNKTFAWAYGGMPYFKPFEIFQQETTNAVMEAMLVADVTQSDSAVCP